MAITDIQHIVGSLTPAKPAVRFLGGAVDDQIQINAFAAARGGVDAAGTISIWLCVPNVTGTYCAFSVGDASAIEYLSITAIAGKIRVSCFDATVEQWTGTTTNAAYEAHKWFNVILKNGAGTKAHPKVFVNGDEKAITWADETDLGTWMLDLIGLDSGSLGAAEEDGAGNLTNEFKGAIGLTEYYNSELSDDDCNKIGEGGTITSGLIAKWDMKDDVIESVTAYNGTIVGDLVHCSSYSEFSSRLFAVATPIVVADLVQFSTTNDTGHAIVVKAA